MLSKALAKEGGPIDLEVEEKSVPRDRSENQVSVPAWPAAAILTS
jgi:hypothetical protein